MTEETNQMEQDMRSQMNLRFQLYMKEMPWLQKDDPSSQFFKEIAQKIFQRAYYQGIADGMDIFENAKERHFQERQIDDCDPLLP